MSYTIYNINIVERPTAQLDDHYQRLQCLPVSLLVFSRFKIDVVCTKEEIDYKVKRDGVGMFSMVKLNLNIYRMYNVRMKVDRKWKMFASLLYSRAKKSDDMLTTLYKEFGKSSITR